MPRHKRTQYHTVPKKETGFRCTNDRHEERKIARKRDWMCDLKHLQVVCPEEHKFTPSEGFIERAQVYTREFVEWLEVEHIECETCIDIWRQELEYQQSKEAKQEEDRIQQMAVTNRYAILALA
uniref:Uncharacterized protein n=1 Tax=Marseillevirus LCMAC102 TaxID=2506603 RepID=A0A481YT61_9VIRU|nr:MAG: hypothetical protein LCMAC102_02680 [Marseillevirus LCMAC102]